jgi:hypothetical protein
MVLVAHHTSDDMLSMRTMNARVVHALIAVMTLLSSRSHPRDIDHSRQSQIASNTASSTAISRGDLGIAPR